MDGTSNDKGGSASGILEFGTFILNESERRLFHAGTFLDIKPKTFEVLLYLAENAGKTVSKDQILEDVWEGSFVEESNLAVHISRIRKIFETTGTQDVISTIPGQGYRLATSVSELTDSEWKKAVAKAAPALDPFRPDEGCESIAVLPLLNENGDPEIDYLADGITEALINNLSCRPNLRVLARNTVFRFKDEDVNVVEVGKRLNVTSVMTGRIRVVNESLALGVELFSVKEDDQVWGAQFNRVFEDIFDLQDEITNSICENLNAEINRASRRFPDQRHTQNTESYRLYLKGKHFISFRRSVNDVLKAEDLLHKSIAIDPSFADAYVELANCFRVQFLYQEIDRESAITRITDLLYTAGELNVNLETLFIQKGYLEMFMHFQFEEAKKHFNKAISINPGSAPAHAHLARLYIYTGNVAKGLEEASICSRLDPVSYVNDKHIAKLFIMARQFENAVLKLKECLELAPNDFEALVLMGFAQCELKQFEESIESFNQALSIQPHAETLAMKGYTFGRMGNKRMAMNTLKKLRILSETSRVPKSFLAVVYAGIGDGDATVEMLEAAFDEKYLDLVALRADPRWDAIRDDKRFEELAVRVGLRKRPR